MKAINRNLTIFEKLILVVGLFVVISGMFFLQRLLTLSGGEFTTDVLIGAVMWLILIFVLILCAIAENGREELGTIIAENSQEIKLLRDISKEHLAEMKLLRHTFSEQSKKR